MAPHPEETENPRDWKKLVLIIGLGALSWVATYVGMLELIEANMGELPLTHRIIVGCSVAMLMTMIIWLLDQIFSPIGTVQRLSYIAGYIFLSAISIGFGFGFYWKVLESRAESTRSAESAVTAVQSSLNAATSRLEQLNATLTQLATVSREKAVLEREKGTSCPNSRPGDGPRRRMRDADAAKFSFAAEFVSGRVNTLKTELRGLDKDFAKIAGGAKSTFDPTSGTRNEFMKSLNRKLDITVTNFNSLRTDPQLKELRSSLADRAAQTTFGDPKRGGFVCPDPQLAQALRGAVRALTEIPVLDKPEIAAVEGSEATIEAFRRLSTSVQGVLTLKPPPSADEIRLLQKKAMQSLDKPSATKIDPKSGGLTSRDYVPLAIAVFVDLCLLLVSIARPSSRLGGLVPKMRDAERGPVIEILSRFNDIHRDQQVRENFELFRHVVFDVHGIYYVAVPLDAPPHLPAHERNELRTEAQLLANLFTSFEKDRIFTRTWTPFTRTIKHKLARQGSKFAASEAFRVYRFRDGAWSEIILGAVMGAARRAEAEALRDRLEESPTLRMPTDDQDLYDETEQSVSSAPSRRTARSSVTSEPEPQFYMDDRLRTRTEANRASTDLYADGTDDWDDAEPSERLDPKFVAQFGVHARQAQDELTRSRRISQRAVKTAANSNTRPSQAASADEPITATAAATAVTDVEADPIETVTLTPAQFINPVEEIIEPDIVTTEPTITETSVTAPKVTDPDTSTHVDVVLKRETATVTMPVQQDRAPESMIADISEALRNAVAPDTQNVVHHADDDAAPLLTHAKDAENNAPTRAEPKTTHVEAAEPGDTFLDLESDPETADAAAIAGRLRPVLVGRS